ncbi:hypothetical protein GGU10DRAFT_381585 [Lentinula aff. detonsa]|uniref:Uncharacterized protein n=1 Tax=Lentinula aff. detonsa TaxID=2804958 RepID=A0AA38KK97_9AGAR|nr:hypothetical protein GGU10DRAFT_381585 [Lentinula aff. detonsa]
MANTFNFASLASSFIPPVAPSFTPSGSMSFTSSHPALPSTPLSHGISTSTTLMMANSLESGATPSPRTPSHALTTPGITQISSSFALASSCTSYLDHLPRSPTPPLNVPTFLIDANTVDQLAKDFGLNNRHRANLHAFIRISSADPPLTRTDMATHVYMLASGYAFEEEVLYQDDARLQGNSDFQAVFEDLKIRLEDKFDITVEQCGSHVALKMTNVFDLPGHKKQLQSVVKKITLSVQNTFCQDIRDSITGAETKSLKDFTFDAASKYKQGGPGEKTDPVLATHCSILRRIAFENKHLLGIEEDVDGNHFWGWIDLFFEKEIAKQRADLSGMGWKSYVEETLTWDTATFKDDVLEEPMGLGGQSMFMDTHSAPVVDTDGISGAHVVPGAQGSALFTFM